LSRRHSRRRFGTQPEVVTAVVRSPVLSSVLYRPERAVVRSVEDRRMFHPEGVFRAPRALGMRPRVVLRKPDGLRAAKAAWHSPVLEVPERVAMCVRRKERREVLHALKRTRGGGGSRRFTFWSKVGC